LLGGIVSLTADSVSVRVRLVAGTSAREVWRGSYGSAASDALLLPGRVAGDLAAKLELDPAEPSGPKPVGLLASGHAPDPRAQEAYLKGVYDIRRNKNMRRFSDEPLRSAIDHLEEAVALEPSWAAAHAQLALAYHWLASGDFGADPAEYYPRSKAEALRAVALDESEAQGYASLGFVLFAHEKDWVGAERAIRRALALEPSSGNHAIYAIYLLASARYGEAIAHFREAEARDPVSHWLKRQLAGAYLCGGRYPEAIQQFEALRRWVGDEAEGIERSLGYAYSFADRDREAAAALEDAVARSDSGARAVAGLAFVYARAGRTDEARSLVRWLDRRFDGWASDAPETPAALGDRERAVSVWWNAYQDHPGRLRLFRCLPSYRLLRDDPRIQEIERSLTRPD
jgi:adenylate cyclase